ncbi:hypothetical protein HS1genome_1851 [Sulfodiicoccus acidiphilus]|uniref:DUF4276 domain-containing protein n=1 Tax=Sulfodiicoccus acidiphilus TaxID=1670455 RepID=A0A348B5L0_9CREN|nr:hypothetical protein [Sulfodiicoccus acidiphilus]BBD73462.1 hypothetical protein HS1genome_1851 [Sulfodiicoccus acidiphilus]GGT92936.1 hypothetical protein GCM10007116_08450 [Sulfodiicoccus acidiphilus]
MRIALLTEDTHAPSFIEKVMERLKEEGRLNVEVVVCKGENSYRKIRPCSDKIRRIINSIIDKCDRILIFQDAHGEDRSEVERRALSHLENLSTYIGKKIFIIIFEEEIEEWILPNTPRPADELKRKEMYEKSSLPSYSSEVDFKKLDRVRSFRDFLYALMVS